jgi:hypothetical protein
VSRGSTARDFVHAKARRKRGLNRLTTPMNADKKSIARLRRGEDGIRKKSNHKDTKITKRMSKRDSFEWSESNFLIGADDVRAKNFSSKVSRSGSAARYLRALRDFVVRFASTRRRAEDGIGEKIHHEGTKDAKRMSDGISSDHSEPRCLNGADDVRAESLSLMMSRSGSTTRYLRALRDFVVRLFSARQWTEAAWMIVKQ